MTINQCILYAMAFGALLGGVDRILGNRFGFGDKFEGGFRLLGPVALSMVGIICLSPMMAAILRVAVGPVCGLLRIDPSIFGSILAIDTGGYQLSLDLAGDPALGRFSGILVASIFGCTVVFTIPVGLGAIGPEDQNDFTRGILLGFLAMPFGTLAGGLMLGLGIGTILWNSLPILLFSLALGIGIIKAPEAMMGGFQRFAECIRILATLGLMLSAVNYLTGAPIFPNISPIEDAMATVSAICVVMLGSMPLAELTQRVMKVPFARIQKKTGLNGTTTTAMLLGLVSATPALVMIPNMDKRGKVVFSSTMVSALCLFGAHMAFAMDVEPDMVPALLVTKAVGGILGCGIALFATRKRS